ncbi:MAG TPA: dipeptidase [Fermentimonas caenicola]|jgi:dipeptidase|uniref:dipeptidase n=1 Tax=Lascolabacillus sp. TaxID=1924068 RepID=UPI0017A14B69|nr:C69 family dipeptidase [Lascolabacillus sp.]MBP6175015.1 C69 family dipeptidase [Fermentimonas sp.]MDI9626322.1 C69 family dipeptidase [Bacteroidota bacterium]HHU41128.1 dipeptidase [Fermentimonas caenicola]MBP6196243.1 C69 family dipeptidase [Fermentimonas sp.]MBP7103588.1 C69 family dipeptidase [Fermentimonas sp.]
MRKVSLIILLVLFTTTLTFPCTNLLVGKKASTDGSTIISYAADSYGLYGELYHWPAKEYKPGEMLKVYEWDSGKYLGEIPQVLKTYNVIGNMNEHQLAIGETTFGGRSELTDSTGIIDYGSLIYITLQRAKNAREAIKIMTSLVSEYGYYSSGESFSIADPNEIWVMEMIGKGPGNKGAVWVAVRIPDDCVTAHANQARIQQFPLNDPENCIYSPDVITFAREKGYFTGKDSEFSFAKAYAPLDFGALRFCEARVWSFFNNVNKDMGKYVTYAQGLTTDPMPLYIKPDRKLSVQDIQNLMRDHYEGTELDWRFDVGAGPFNSPYRWSPLTYQVDSVEYCNERPIATQQTAFSFVAQMRSWLPNEIGGILWFGIDDAAQTVYYPFYCGHNEVPHEMKIGNGDLLTFSWTSAFWIHNWVSNLVYTRYSDMSEDMKKVQSALENSFHASQPQIEEKALSVLEQSNQDAVKYLTSYTNNLVTEGVAEWKKLGEFLMVKYIDGVIKQEENGKFKRNPYGQPANPLRPGYSNEYYQKIIDQTGDKYKVQPVE